MAILTKIEELINKLILMLWGHVGNLVKRLIPSKVTLLLDKVRFKRPDFKGLAKEAPQKIKDWAIDRMARSKTDIAELKTSFAEKVAAAKKYAAEQKSTGAGKLKTILISPVVFIAQWFQGLTPTQTVVLIAFTVGSIISGFGIFQSYKRIATAEAEANRVPASAEVDEYSRPDYYKKDTRHVLVTSVRLPVHFAEVNELRTVDIDFNLTLSNRESRLKLDKLEFQLRDYLILHVEPIVASFPLEDEGREILKKKIWQEVDNFLVEREINGHVLEVKITYVLAN